MCALSRDTLLTFADTPEPLPGDLFGVLLKIYLLAFGEALYFLPLLLERDFKYFDMLSERFM